MTNRTTRRHRALVTTKSDGTHVTIAIVCDSCAGGTFTIVTAHLQTLARVLPKICVEMGMNLDDDATEAHVLNFDEDDPVARAGAEALYRDFLQRTKPDDN